MNKPRTAIAVMAHRRRAKKPASSVNATGLLKTIIKQDRAVIAALIGKSKKKRYNAQKILLEMAAQRLSLEHV